jgi:hypothetical protein
MPRRRTKLDAAMRVRRDAGRAVDRSDQVLWRVIVW